MLDGSRMAAASAGKPETSTPGRSCVRVRLVKTAGRCEAAAGARSKRPAEVNRVIGAPARRS
jgi:hypothetical protein